MEWFLHIFVSVLFFLDWLLFYLYAWQKITINDISETHHAEVVLLNPISVEWGYLIVFETKWEDNETKCKVLLKTSFAGEAYARLGNIN